MSYILNIETATKNCSVCVAKNGVVVALKEAAELGFSHAERLHVFIEAVCQDAQISFSDLNAAAVSQGPGSYTGLRIGVSAAKGLCYALDIPLIATDTLQCLANKVQIKNGLIVPMLDARRMEVYSAVYDSKFELIRDVEAQILDEYSFLDATQTYYFVGDCNQKAKTVLNQSNHHFLDEFEFPSAQEMAAISHEKFVANKFEDVAYFEPLYLKDFILSTKKT